MSSVMQDCRFALRTWRRQRGAVSLTLMVLAIAIGLNVAIYSVVRGVLLRPLPFDNAKQLVDVEMTTAALRPSATIGQMPTYGLFRIWQRQSTSFDGFAAYGVAQPVLTGPGVAERVSVAGFTSNLLPLLGAHPALGREFSPEEDVPGASRVVLLGWAFWRTRFGGDSTVLGRSLILDGLQYRIIGVMPESFRFPRLPSAIGQPDAQVWTTLSALLTGQTESARGGEAVWVLGRLRQGVSLSAAQRELDTITQRNFSFAPDDAWRLSLITPLHEFITGQLRTALLVIWGAAVFVLLVACASVGSFFAARAIARQQEMTLRAALGATRGRILTQLVTESLLLTSLAGAIGVLLAIWGTPLLLHLGGAEVAPAHGIGVDGGALVTALIAVVVIGLFFGTAPIAYLFGSSAAAARQGTHGSGGPTWRSRLSDWLVVAQVALTLVLLTGAGLLLRSFANLVQVQLGFRADHVLVAQVSLDAARYSESETRLAFARAALQLTQGRSHTTAAAVATSSPMIGGGFSVVSRPASPSPLGSRPAWIVGVTPDYFRVLGIPLLRGRDLDFAAGSDAIVIDDEAAREFFPGLNPIGQTISWHSKRDRGTVVGIVGTVRQDSPGNAAPPHVYIPLERSVAQRLQLLLRTTDAPAKHIKTVRAAIAALDPALPIDRILPLEDLLKESRAKQRFYAVLVGVFAAAALIMAVAGVYATANLAVQGRLREIGLRAALGASRTQLFVLVLRRGLAIGATGAALGVVGALIVTRGMAGLLYGVKFWDPFSFVSVIVVIMLASFFASYLPGRKAAMVDPMITLRSD